MLMRQGQSSGPPALGEHMAVAAAARVELTQVVMEVTEHHMMLAEQEAVGPRALQVELVGLTQVVMEVVERHMMPAEQVSSRQPAVYHTQLAVRA